MHTKENDPQAYGENEDSLQLVYCLLSILILLLQARVLSMIGVMQPFSDLDRYMADKFVLLMTTGRPWVQTSDPGLRVGISSVDWPRKEIVPLNVCCFRRHMFVTDCPQACSTYSASVMSVLLKSGICVDPPWTLDFKKKKACLRLFSTV